jgi:hypothetical protein
MTLNLHPMRVSTWTLTVLFALCLARPDHTLAASPSDGSKVIHLRNQAIRTEAKRAQPSPDRPDDIGPPKARRLHILQFEGEPCAEWRATLEGLGVDLICYVPEDAFLADLGRTPPGQIRRLDFVRWMGPYQAEHKVHVTLQQQASTPTTTAELLDVSVLLAPRAPAVEVAGARNLFNGKSSESPLRQGTILRGRIPAARLAELADSDAVLWVEPAPRMKLFDEEASKIVGGDDGNRGTPTVTQQLGYDGSGVRVAVADSGLDSGDTNSMHPDLAGRVQAILAYGLPDGADEHSHGTHVAGIIAGNAATGEADGLGARYGLGVASGAHIVSQRIFDDTGGFTYTNASFEQLTRDAVNAGALVGNNSWGEDTQGRYDLSAMEFDALVRDANTSMAGDQPYILEFSAGNAGPGEQTIGSPALAKNVLATGATENNRFDLPIPEYPLYGNGQETMGDFSSRGPCEDGRIKPDLVAPGTWIASLRSVFANDSYAWWPISDNYMYQGGTSQAGPHAAGAAAVFVQFYRSHFNAQTPSPALIKAALINAAVDMDDTQGDTGPVPNNDEGWGRLDLTELVVTNLNSSPRYHQYLDQTVPLTNGQVHAQHLLVQESDQPLKITLTYTDVPGFPGAIPALVNDLDLEVVAPDGTLYRGNQFGAGESAPNPPAPDQLNNVEGVLLPNPIPGDYLLRVRGSRVVSDALTNTPTRIDQDFALVSSGNLVRPGTGFILLDRPSYTAPGVMLISVFDAARAQSNTVSVLVSNRTSLQSFSRTLNAAGNYGLFTGAVNTVTGTPGPGQLQLANGDQLEAAYLDSLGIKRTATAVGDRVVPAISAVTNFVDAGVLTITWQTSEPATSIVRYGTNSANLNLGVTNRTLTTSHRVKLTGLIPGQTYFYLVTSADAAGNTATDNRGGLFYTFIGVLTPTVLLVDAYEPASGSPVIPDSAYTNVLTSAGISYGFWKVIQRGSPQLPDLQPYPVVIWRLTDDIVNYGFDSDGLPDPAATNNTLNPQQQSALQAYLNGGGSLFMGSMSLLSQLGNVPFRRTALQVAGFKRNPDPPMPCSECDEDFRVPAILGAPASLAEGLDPTLDYTDYPWFDFDGLTLGPDFSDTFTPSSLSKPITFESVSGKPCGLSYPRIGVDSPGRVVFLSFPFDAVPTNGPTPNNATSLLKSVIRFLAPGANGAGVVFLDKAVYTTNDLLIVEVGDSSLASTGPAQVTFGASSRTNRTTVTLLETTHAGLFRGSLTLVGTTAGTNQLQVSNGDLLTATYFDASNNSNVTATAGIDTVPPTISDVTATADIANAQVTWRTSKPADSAVQYGLSQFLGQAAYVNTPVTNHAVLLQGLSPNRTYYYRAVSRDLAGNTTVDDNNGNFYTFQTLQAPAPPWFTDLETETNGWTVVPDAENGSDYNWLLGTPNSALATSAASGTNAWGCSLDGEQPSFIVSSFLASPIIDLSGVTSATLTFSNRCDFSRLDPVFGIVPIEDGLVSVRTNSSVPISADLPVAKDFVGTVANDWQLATVNLTPFIGQSVQIVFYYQGAAMGLPLFGWLIDDIRITGTAAVGNIAVAKNLEQGTWSLASVSQLGLVPVQTGVTPSVTLTNLSAGEYVVQFGDVPYYQTPADQTNTLTAGSTISFAGTYGFLDGNSNGIPDSWERDYFGSATTNRTQFTDTDGDGMSDYAEFMAGTNPTNTASRLSVSLALQSNAWVRLQWPSTPDHGYRVESSTNLLQWTPRIDWARAGTSTMTQVLDRPLPATHYRVQVRP